MLAPLKSLHSRLSAFICGPAFGPQQKYSLDEMEVWLFKIIRHSGNLTFSAEDVWATIDQILGDSPWIKCQASLNRTTRTPCAAAVVFNEETLAYSGLSMCAKVRACVTETT